MRDLLGQFAGIAVWLLVAAALWQRLHFGVDFTDEGLYVGVPTLIYRDGLRPLIDEANLSTSGASLVALFLPFAGDLNEGIVLFVRKLYFAFVALQSAVVYLCVSGLVRPRFAWILCAIPLAFVPHNLPSLSYNTMGGGLLLIGTMLAWQAARTEGRAECALGILSGVLFALSAMAHVAFGLAALCLCAMSFAATMQGNPRFALSQTFGLVAGAAAAYVLLRMPSLPAIWELHFSGPTTQTDPAGMYKVRAALTAMLAPLLPFNTDDTRRSLALWNLMFLVFAPLVFLLPVGRGTERRTVILRLMVPSCAVGLFMGYASTNSLLNSSIATLAATIAGAVWLARWADSKPFPALSWNIFLLLATIVALSTYASRNPYRDGHVDALDFRVESGPYRGLLTTSVKHEFLESLDTDRMELKKAAPDARHVLFFDRFPAGYLLVPYKPCTDTVWLFPLGRYPNLHRTRTLRAFQSRGCEPDIVFIMRRVPYQEAVFDTLRYFDSDPLYAFVADNPKYTKWKERPGYSIYLREAKLPPT